MQFWNQQIYLYISFIVARINRLRCVSKLTRAILATVLFVAKNFQQGRALLLPHCVRVFLDNCPPAKDNDDPHLQLGDGTIKFSSRWLLPLDIFTYWYSFWAHCCKSNMFTNHTYLFSVSVKIVIQKTSPQIIHTLGYYSKGNIMQNIWLILEYLQFGVWPNRLHHSLVHHVYKKYIPNPWSPRLRGIIQLSRIGNVLRNIWLIL